AIESTEPSPPNEAHHAFRVATCVDCGTVAPAPRTSARVCSTPGGAGSHAPLSLAACLASRVSAGSAPFSILRSAATQVFAASDGSLPPSLRYSVATRDRHFASALTVPWTSFAPSTSAAFWHFAREDSGDACTAAGATSTAKATRDARMFT